MLDVPFVTSLFIFLDFLILKLMISFYFSIGIPMLKKQIQIKPDRTIEDIGIYIGISDYLVYKKVSKNKLIFRNKFTYNTLYKLIGMLSVI